MKKLLFIIIQWIWGFPQNLAGLFVFLFQKYEYREGNYNTALVTRWNRTDSLSLGMFIFIGKGRDMRIVRHEYGHSIQSMILGPFYLIAVGIPSVLWCHLPALAKQWKSGKVSYFSRYPENWADSLGHADSEEC